MSGRFNKPILQPRVTNFGAKTKDPYRSIDGRPEPRAVIAQKRNLTRDLRQGKIPPNATPKGLQYFFQEARRTAPSKRPTAPRKKKRPTR